MDSQQYGERFAAIRDELFGVAVRKLRDEQVADDVVQDSYFKGLKAVHQYRGGSFRAWMGSIVWNASIDIYRADRKWIDFEIDSDWMSNPGLLDGHNDPEKKVAYWDMEDRVAAAIRKLPDCIRETYILGRIVGMPYREVADLLDVNIVTVRSRIHRGKAMMREMLEGQL